MQQVESIAAERPRHAGDWDMERTLQALKRPIPQSMLKIKKIQGNQIPYLPWHTVVDILNKYAPGWTWEITQMHTSGDRLFLVGRLTLVTSEGTVYQEATGTEELTCSSYGDPSSNAESMALRRAAAKFGLALDLYKK